MSVMLEWTLAVWLAATAAPVIEVDGHRVPAESWAFLELTRGGDATSTPAHRQRLIEQAVDRELIRGFLAKQTLPDATEALDLRLYELEELIRRREGDPEMLFKRLQLSKDAVRRELQLAVDWENYVQQTASLEAQKKFFEAHRSELDGTRVNVRQIFRKATDDAQRLAARELLEKLRSDITAGRLTFPQAAEQHSQAPSARQGGEIGWIVGRGQLPLAVSQAVLKLQAGELTEPITTEFGVHLATVEAREAGQLSLEDARPQVLRGLADQMWQEQVARLRKQSRINVKE